MVHDDDDHSLSGEHRKEVGHFLSAYRECTGTVQYCISGAAGISDGALIRLLQDCADISMTTANALMRESPYAARFAWIAGDLASAAAEKCGAIDDDVRFKVCYAAVLRAAMTAARLCGVGEDVETDDDSLRDWIVKGSFPASDPPPGPATL